MLTKSKKKKEITRDLNATTGPKTIEVESGRKGVAIMNGFSPALKVFMGEVSEWEVMRNSICNLNVMKKEIQIGI